VEAESKDPEGSDGRVDLEEIKELHLRPCGAALESP
jgi:hypothetical protein